MGVMRVFTREGGEKGQTLVEFTLILLLLMTILFGVVEFSRAWYFSSTLINGVRAGARFATTQTVSPASGTLDQSNPYVLSIKSYTFKQITTVFNATPGTNLFVNVSAYDTRNNPITAYTSTTFSNSTALPVIKVIARYQFDVFTGGLIPVFSGPKVIRRSAAMRYEHG